MLRSSLAAGFDVWMPPLAPLVLLSFLGVGLLVSCSVVASAIALASRRARLAKAIGGAGLAAAVLYGAVWLGAALLSDEKTLSWGEKKYFCEIDCHLAYSIPGPTTVAGTLRIVAVRTWFDPDTIASFRGNDPLTPNPRTVYLVDASGRRYEPSSAATKAWEAQHGRSTPLTQMLRPGESYTTRFVFDAPPEARDLRLFIGDPPGPETLLIGHENSPFHEKVFHALGPDKAAS